MAAAEGIIFRISSSTIPRYPYAAGCPGVGAAAPRSENRIATDRDTPSAEAPDL